MANPQNTDAPLKCRAKLSRVITGQKAGLSKHKLPAADYKSPFLTEESIQKIMAED